MCQVYSIKAPRESKTVIGARGGKEQRADSQVFRRVPFPNRTDPESSFSQGRRSRAGGRGKIILQLRCGACIKFGPL
jgi:hypothetical protein